MKENLLKDITIDIEPNCPIEYVHKSGSEGIICDRNGFKYIVSEPLLLGVLKLYDLNIRTLSCGSNEKGEIGISCDWDSLDDKNKRIVKNYLKNKKQCIIPPCEHAPQSRFRISVHVASNETIKGAEQKILQEIEGIGLTKQDVLYGKLNLDEIKDIFSYGLDLSLEDAIINFEIQGGVLEGDIGWLSQELYKKHLEYIKYCEEFSEKDL